MSWAEVFKINNNPKKSLNEQIRDNICLPMNVITTTSNFTPAKTGLYKIICVGAGGASEVGTGSLNGATGGAGGVAITDITLTADTSYSVTITTDAKIVINNRTIIGYHGTDAYILTSTVGTGGTASGGDINYKGGDGSSSSTAGSVKGGSVGVNIVGLTNFPIISESNQYVYNNSTYTVSHQLSFGNSLLDFGGGGGCYLSSINTLSNAFFNSSSNGKPAAVIIIPLEVD